MRNRIRSVDLSLRPRRRPLPGWTALVIALALAALFPALAWAGWAPTQQAVEDDLFLIGQTPVISGTVLGNVFAVGRDVRLGGNVEGSMFVLADQFTLEGRVAGSVYAAALTLRQNAGSQIDQSLNAAALNLVTERSAVITRDLRTVAVSANLRGAVGRNTQARIGLFELLRVLQRGVTGGITSLPQPAPVEAWLPALRIGYAFAGLPALAVDRTLKFQAPTDQTAAESGSPWLGTLKSLLVLLLIGGVTLWLFPAGYARMEQQARQRPLAATGAGAVILVNGFLMPALITVLIGSAFFGLIFFSIPDLAWMLFGVGFGLLLTGFCLFLLATAYLSKALVASLVGGLILRRFLPRLAQQRLPALVLGLLIYVILVSLPYLGFTVGLLVTMLGLGSMWLGRRPALDKPAGDPAAIQPPAPVAEPAAVETPLPA